MNAEIEKLTKKYILDLLNLTFFGEELNWDSVELYNSAPLLDSEEEGYNKREQRGVVLVHKRKPFCMGLIITVIDEGKQSVCYRLFSIKETLKVIDGDKERTFTPSEFLDIDLSIADTNLGFSDPSSCSFCNNKNTKFGLWSLLKFILDSNICTTDDLPYDKAFLADLRTWPPLAGDIHFSPIYEALSDA